jgi:hypothetical protein
MISCKFTQTPFLFLEFQLSNSSAILYNAFYGGRMHFVDELSVHFFNEVEAAAIAAAKGIKSSEAFAIDSPGVIRVIIN